MKLFYVIFLQSLHIQVCCEKYDKLSLFAYLKYNPIFIKHSFQLLLANNSFELQRNTYIKYSRIRTILDDSLLSFKKISELTLKVNLKGDCLYESNNKQKDYY